MPSDKQDKAAKPSARRWTKTLTLFASIGWLAAGLLAADKINAQNMTSSLHNALVRSQTERHILSQELVRTDSTCGKEAVLAAELEERIQAIGMGKVWREEVFDGRSNTLWQVDSGRGGGHPSRRRRRPRPRRRRPRLRECHAGLLIRGSLG